MDRLPEGELRLWVLSSCVKNVLVHMLKIPEDHVALIPRYELWSMSAAPMPPPDPTQPMTFVYAGRVSRSKNIKTLLKTTSLLQTKHRLPVQLFILGAFDDEPNADFIETHSISYSTQIAKQIVEEQWETPPELIDGLGPREWMKLRFSQPVFVSFSTLLFEDFGVSVAQAEAKGWPTILSNWGGHLDTCGTYQIKISPQRIRASNISESTKLLELPSVEAIAATIAHQIKKREWITPQIPAKMGVQPPRTIRQNLLKLHRDQLIVQLLKTKQLDSHLKLEKSHPRFRVHNDWAREYRALFSRSSSK